MLCSMERTLLSSPREIKQRKRPAPLRGAGPDIDSTNCSAFGDRRLADAAAVIDVGDTAAHIHEAAAIVGVGLGAAMLMGSKAGTGRDQATDDDVLLEAAQVVLEATHRGFGQHARGF